MTINDYKNPLSRSGENLMNTFLNLLIIALDTLSNGCTLYENQFLISSNGRFKAIIQENAQFLVIVIDKNIFI